MQVSSVFNVNFDRFAACQRIELAVEYLHWTGEFGRVLEDGQLDR